MLEPKTITVPELVDLCYQYTMLSVHLYSENGRSGMTLRFKTNAVAPFTIKGRATGFMATNGFNSFDLDGESFTMTIKEQRNQGGCKFMSFTLQNDDFCCTMHLIA